MVLSSVDISFCLYNGKDMVKSESTKLSSPKLYFLWDDDAEGGDSLCLVLMEREAAAAYSHDLAGEGETDSASFRLRGEERDENVEATSSGMRPALLLTSMMMDSLGVGVGFETDKCLLACHGLQICGAAFLVSLSFSFESFYGILQKIRYYVREEALIGVNQQILGRNLNLYFVVAEQRHSFQEWFHIEESRLRLGNMGETAIVVDESQQFGSCFVDGFKPCFKSLSSVTRVSRVSLSEVTGVMVFMISWVSTRISLIQESTS